MHDDDAPDAVGLAPPLRDERPRYGDDRPVRNADGLRVVPVRARVGATDSLRVSDKLVCGHVISRERHEKRSDRIAARDRGLLVV